MHYKHIYGNFNTVLSQFNLSNRYKKDAKNYGQEALWIVIIDAFKNLVGLCVLGEENKDLCLYELEVSKEYKNCKFENRLLDLSKTYAQDKNKKIFVFVNKDDNNLVDFYKHNGFTEDDTLVKHDHVALSVCFFIPK